MYPKVITYIFVDALKIEFPQHEELYVIQFVQNSINPSLLFSIIWWRNEMSYWRIMDDNPRAASLGKKLLSIKYH